MMYTSNCKMWDKQRPRWCVNWSGGCHCQFQYTTPLTNRLMQLTKLEQKYIFCLCSPLLVTYCLWKELLINWCVIIFVQDGDDKNKTRWSKLFVERLAQSTASYVPLYSSPNQIKSTYVCVCSCSNVHTHANRHEFPRIVCNSWTKISKSIMNSISRLQIKQ